jgi:hypothetical protein
MHKLDYTGVMYEKLIRTVSNHFTTYSIQDYFEAHVAGALHGRHMIMRHDVDADTPNALSMAKIDAAYGIRSTFYFRMKPRLFRPKIIQKIKSLGHEIGYHYEVLSDTDGDYERARCLFVRNLNALRKIAPVRTACMHGRSLSKYNNLDFFRRFRLETFDLIAEPYLSIDYSDKYYFTDTGLCWDNQRFNVRDHVNSKGSGGVRNTNELIRFIQTQLPQKAALLTHTNNWVDSMLFWSIYKTTFFVLNSIKSYRKKLTMRKDRRKP